ncbi:HECT E3 ubiquitin ligase [Thraustotheca clavata]|uniref:HECT-type E3 ubiquitin transferase n=1 Tax=Thraustotheca clavata TaxID=74557 RepID=A0A1W0A7D5_9STRA|nr:HECT E3 ubiquitin ligase [Thraustotheca clavata]
MDSQTSSEIVFLVSIATLFLCLGGIAKYCTKVSTGDGGYPLHQPVLSNFMPGLKRGDVEDLLSDVDRWECPVCSFKNVVDRPLCCLCGAKKDCKFVEPSNEIEHFNKSYRHDLARQSSQNRLSRQRSNPSLLFRQSSKNRLTPNNRMNRISSFFSRMILPEDLSARQRSARMRKEWSRHVDIHGQPYWRRRCLDTNHVPAAFVIQMDNEEDSFDTLKIKLMSPVLEDAEAQVPTLETESQLTTKRLTYVPIEAVDAAKLVTGQMLSEGLWPLLHSISKLPFNAKYAWLLHQVADLVLPYEVGYLQMRAQRESVFHEALENLLHLKSIELCAIVRLQFLNEKGVDAGAIQREWYMLVSQALLTEEVGLFVQANREDHSYILNPNSKEAFKFSEMMTDLDAYRAAGRFIGRAILDGQVLPLHFNPTVFKAILGIPLTMDDIECLDSTVYKSLKYILETDSVEDLTLTFSVTSYTQDGQVTEIDLIPKGSQILVKESNKYDYIDHMVRYLLFGRCEGQLLALIQGIHDILPPELLIPLDHKELELVLCGLTDIDTEDWKANTVLSVNLKDTPVVQWFWEIVESLSLDEHVRLLQFATGSTRVPVQGFKGLTSYDGKICYFTLKGVPYMPGMYPVAHACYNRIDLPIYPTKELLQEAISMLLLSDPTGFNIS